ncbi:MAG: M1 family aminopeptidase, partial [Longimicrobiales bacterium]
WFPMQVGSNETRHPWMDEGFTQFNTAQAMRVLYGEPRFGGRPNDSEPGQRGQYIARANGGDDQSLMQHGDMFPLDLYNTMYYNKTSQVLVALRGMLGDDTFRRAFREYGARWTGRHPYAYDFFHTVEDVARRDLGWFWTTWFYNAWPLDQAIGAVRMNGAALFVTIQDRGLAPMPAVITITRAGGATEMRTVPVDVWLSGKRSTTISIARGAQVTRVEIDAAAAFPDLDRTNQVWVKK